jgi:ribosomal protein S18 acetylase RimI-like enzyme
VIAVTLIRPAHTSDADAIAVVHANSWRLSHRGALLDEYLDGPVYEERRAFWTQCLANVPFHQRVLVSVQGDVIAGFISLCAAQHPSWGSWIEAIHINHLLSRSGIGSELLLAAAASLPAKAQDLPMYVLVAEKNKRARAFFESFAGTVDDYCSWSPPGGGTVPMARYGLPAPTALKRVGAGPPPRTARCRRPNVPRGCAGGCRSSAAR